MVWYGMRLRDVNRGSTSATEPQQGDGSKYEGCERI